MGVTHRSDGRHEAVSQLARPHRLIPLSVADDKLEFVARVLKFSAHAVGGRL